MALLRMAELVNATRRCGVKMGLRRVARLLI